MLAKLVCVLGVSACSHALRAPEGHERPNNGTTVAMQEVMPPNVIQGIGALNSLLLVCVLCALRSALNRLSLQGSTKSSLCVFSVVVLLMYCFFAVAHPFFTNWVQAIQLSVVIPTILVYVLKLPMAIIMYLCTDGTCKELLRDVTSDFSVVLRYTIPAACLALYDLFSFVSLYSLSPGEYMILLHLRTILIAWFWQLTVGKRLTGAQWGLLLLCIYAVLTTERTQINSMLSGGKFAGLAAYGTMGLQYMFSITGNLSNEKFLKQVQLSVNAQNVILYSLSILFLSVLLVGLSLVKGPIFKMDELPNVLNPMMTMSIVSLSLQGICTGFVLKYFGNIWKEFAGMTNTFATVLLDWLVFGQRKPTVLDYTALAILSCSMTTFSLLDRLAPTTPMAKQQHDPSEANEK